MYKIVFHAANKELLGGGYNLYPGTGGGTGMHTRVPVTIVGIYLYRSVPAYQFDHSNPQEQTIQIVFQVVAASPLCIPGYPVQHYNL